MRIRRAPAVPILELLMNDLHAGWLQIPAIQAAWEKLRPFVVETPLLEWRGFGIQEALGPSTRVTVKLELFQHTGSFKARGALMNLLALDQQALARGVTAVSSGNHAIATAFAARELKSSAKVVMLQSANAARVALCRAFGAEVLISKDGATAFRLAQQIVADEGRTMVHPYDGRDTMLGTASLGLEFGRQAGPFDAVVIPIGGGGLCGGMAAAIKQAMPDCRIFGVEPVGADVMHRSFAACAPCEAGAVRTIADSLGAPFTTAMSYGLCRKFVDELVLVDDAQTRFAMALMFRELKLAVEPAAAVAAAALLGPLASRLKGLHVGIVACGANIDFQSYSAHIAAAPDVLGPRVELSPGPL